jgi:hypothetical protein
MGHAALVGSIEKGEKSFEKSFAAMALAGVEKNRLQQLVNRSFW